MNVVTPCQMYWLTRCDYLGECLRSLQDFAFFLAVVTFMLTGLVWAVSQFAGNGIFDLFCGKSDKELEEIHAQYRRRMMRESATTGMRSGITRHTAAICACLERLRRESRLPPLSVPAEKGTATPK